MVYVSPCYPCEYNFYSVDEFGDCNEEKEQKCWIEQWIKEQHLNE